MSNPMQTPGAFSWNELITTDPEAAKKFYAALFHWETMDFPMNDVDYCVLKNGDDMIGGIMGMPKEAPEMPPTWGCYVTVSDCDATCEKVVALGGKIALPPQDIPNVGRMAVLQDPQGAMLSVIAYFTT